MDYFIKQSSRVSFAGQTSGGPHKERRKPLLKTLSFKEEKKKAQNWFRGQISSQMNRDYDLNEIERATAVAAAACAIVSITDDSSIPNKKILGDRPQPSFNRIKSRKEDTTASTPEPTLTRIESRKFSGEGKHSMRTSEIEEEEGLETAASYDSSPSIKRTPRFPDKPVSKPKRFPTFADEQFNTRDEIRPESLKPKTDTPAIEPQMTMPKSDLSTPQKPAISPAKIDKPASTKPVTVLGGTEADAWERARLTKIKERYEKVDARIVSWENEKKTKARRRLDKAESELEKKRLKSLEQFRSEIDDINQIAGGARSKARERREREEKKTKEKANIFRKTGKLPRTCFCF